jgi:DNA polymerase-3 subunit delta
MTGEDTRQAAQEITKLLTYVNYAHSIGLEDVEAVSIVTASVDVFDLVDALGAQNGKLAQKLFHRLLEDKDAFEVFGMVVRQFRLLTLARDVMDAGGTLQEVTDVLGVHPFVAEKSFQQARNFTMDTLKGIYHRLLAMDEAAKTGGMPLEASLDILIVELVGSR